MLKLVQALTGSTKEPHPDYLASVHQGALITIKHGIPADFVYDRDTRARVEAEARRLRAEGVTSRKAGAELDGRNLRAVK